MANIENKNRKSSAINDKKRLKRIEAMKKRKREKRKRIFIFTLSIIIALLLGTFAYGYNFISSLKTNNLGEGIKPESKTDPINILILGMDVGDTDNQENKAIRRSDTIMVFNYNPNTKKAHLISVPRDTLIEVDAYLDTGEYQRYWKINSAYALGGEEEITMHVESLLGIDINYIVEIDYDAFRNTIDAIGGVDMYIEQDMFYDDDEQDLHINFKGGETVHLDGKKAEEFFRWRQNNDGTGLPNGDIDRIENQQIFIGKVLEKALSPSIVFKVPKILKVISENIETNVDANTLIKLGLKILKLDSSDIIMTTLQGVNEDIYGQSFYVVYDELNADLKKALNSSNPSEISSITSAKREDLKLMVLNGTKINGLAGTARDKLLSLGYYDIAIGNCDSTEKSTIQTNNKDLKETLSSDTKISKFSKITSDEYKDYDAVIILGTDYNLFGE